MKFHHLAIALYAVFVVLVTPDLWLLPIILTLLLIENTLEGRK